MFYGGPLLIRKRKKNRTKKFKEIKKQIKKKIIKQSKK